MEHLVNPEISNVDVEMLRNVARLATNLDLTNDLLENSRFLANANRFTNQTQRHSRFNLLPLDQAFEIRMHQARTHWIDLAIRKHHFSGFDAFDIDGEDRVAAAV